MGENPFADDLGDVELPVLQDEVKTTKKTTSQTGSSYAPNSKEAMRERLEQLKRREESLKRRRQELNNNTDQSAAQNWPSFFPILRYKPETDLPVAARKCVKMCLVGLCVYTAHAIWNIIAILSITDLPKYNFTKNVVMGILQGVAAFYIFLKFGYSKLYVSCAKHDIQLSWTVIQIAIVGWSIYLTVGFIESGCAGVSIFLDLITKSKNTWSKIAAFVNVALLCTNLFCQFSTFIQSQQYQKVSGKEDTTQLTQADSPEQPLNI